MTITPAIPPDGIARPVADALDRIASRWLAHLGALRALDATGALATAGFVVTGARWVRRGYPSLCLLAASG